MKRSDELMEQLEGKSAEEVTAVLFRFMEERGLSNYDEAVTQLEHALQSADLASQRGLPPHAITAALFHDIGHLLLDEHDKQADFLDVDMAHEIAGDKLMRRWFPESVTEPIRLHVAAKRYLCSTDSTYYDQLSEASQRSFQVQGGNLSAEELAEFEKNPNLEIAVALRRIDDEAKVREKDVPGIHVYATVVTESQVAKDSTNATQ